MTPFVNDEGEISRCPDCIKHENLNRRLEEELDNKDIVIKELQRKEKGWALENGKLRRLNEGDGWKHDPHYNDAFLAFKEWRSKCEHPRSQFTRDRFKVVRPWIANDKYGLRMVLLAIDGAAYDPFIVTRRNGTKKRLDDWERIFKDAGSIEEFACRAPIAELRAVG